MVQIFDDINQHIVTDVSHAVSNANSYFTTDIYQTIAYINNTATNVGLQLLSIFNSTDCTKIYPCANTTYINLTSLVKNAHQSLINCMTPVSTYLQTNATKLVTEYTAAKNSLENAVTTCSPDILTFDSCLTVSKPLCHNAIRIK